MRKDRCAAAWAAHGGLFLRSLRDLLYDGIRHIYEMDIGMNVVNILLLNFLHTLLEYVNIHKKTV